MFPPAWRTSCSRCVDPRAERGLGRREPSLSVDGAELRRREAELPLDHAQHESPVRVLVGVQDAAVGRESAPIDAASIPT